MDKEIIGLIAGNSGDALTNELHKMGYTVALVCGKSGEPGYDIADNLLIKNLTEYEDIIGYFKSLNIRYVIIGTGHYLAINLSEKLEKAGFILNIKFERSMLAKDKRKFKECVENLGFLTPKYYCFNKNFDLDEIKSKIRIPCVLKSTIDKCLPQKVDNEHDLLSAIDEIKKLKSDILVEEYIDGNDCTVAVYCTKNTYKAIGCLYYSKAKECSLKGFNSSYSEKLNYDMEEKISKIAVEIAEKLNFMGIVRIDFIIRGDDAYILELNSVLVTGEHGTGCNGTVFKDINCNIAKLYVENALEQFGF